MLVSNTTRRVEIPHEEGEWMEVKKLSWRQLEKASDIATDESFDRLKKMGGDIIAAFSKREAEEKQDPTTKYDRASILQMGIVKWSYDAEVKPENIDLLDEETAEWAFQEILKPKTEEEAKNA